DFGGCGAVASPLQETFGFAVTASQFESLLLLKSPESVGIEEDFEVLDANHNGRVDRLELRLKTKQDFLELEIYFLSTIIAGLCRNK
ncbi:hypothetical protein L915_01569, partial [Phytophthora nicotianae]